MSSIQALLLCFYTFCCVGNGTHERYQGNKEIEAYQRDKVQNFEPYQSFLSKIAHEQKVQGSSNLDVDKSSFMIEIWSKGLVIGIGIMILLLLINVSCLTYYNCRSKPKQRQKWEIPVVA